MRIFIADDQSSVRSALCCLLEQEPGLVVVGQVSRWRDLSRRVRSSNADLLLLDWELPGLVAADLARLLQPLAKVIVLSSRPESRQAALSAGADAFVSKSDAPECVLEAIHSVMRVS